MSCRTKAVEGGARDEMSLDVEDVVNGGMDGDEARGRASRFEGAHLALSSSSAGVRFGPVVGTQTLVVAAKESNKRLWTASHIYSSRLAIETTISWRCRR